MSKAYLVPLVALLLLVGCGVVVSAQDNLWDITCSDVEPYIGDPVRFDVESLYRGDYVVLVVEVVNTTGRRVDISIIRISEWGSANWTWESDLDDEPGEYSVVFSYNARPIADFTIVLVYDELDWMVKYARSLEERLQRQDDRIMEAVIIASRAQENINDYIVAPGLVAIFTSCINLLLIALVGVRYYVDAVRERLMGSRHLSWIAHAFAPQTDGNFNRMPGYENVNEPDRELTDEEFVERSRRYLETRTRPMSRRA